MLRKSSHITYAHSTPARTPLHSPPVIFNTLDGMQGYGDAKSGAEPGQTRVLVAMESGRMPLRKSHAAIYTAKDAGIDITAGARAQEAAACSGLLVRSPRESATPELALVSHPADYRLDASDVPITYYSRPEFGDLKDVYPSFSQKRTVRRCARCAQRMGR